MNKWAQQIMVMALVTTAGGVGWAQPEIDEILPDAAHMGCTVALVGNGFSADPQENDVSFNGTAAEVVYSDDWLLLTVVPAQATSGLVTVTVADQSSNAVPFTVLGAEGPPALDVIEPAAGPVGALVVLTGTNLGDFWCGQELEVAFNGTESPWAVATDSTTIFTVVPNTSAGDVAVVAVVDGVSSNAVRFAGC
ncbi:MAG: IPT/TIG domain-containing protein [Planctomycetes bacterium]|nr:IPT/TIG domain-containing protein [Planctomycetota bacterium]